MRPENDSSIEVQSVRKALKDWLSLKDLAENPLAGLSLVENRRKAGAYTATPSGFGLALREVLEQAMLHLKPEDAPPQMSDKRWRPYFILRAQYLEGRSPDFIQQQLHIARGTYFSEQKRGIKLLTESLCRLVEHTACESEGEQAAQGVHSVAPCLSPALPLHPFIGRDTLFSCLREKLLPATHEPVLLSPSLALQGLPGAGKTRIALELACDTAIRQAYPDGVLWAGLGTRPDLAALLGQWAAALHISDEVLAVHTELKERISLLHSVIGNRRMLLVIDDAWQSEAALVFKLGGVNCAYVLTTRLIDVAVDFAGSDVVNVCEMELQDGMALLQYFLPDLREDGSKDAISLVRSVGGLPLALILIGRYLQKYRYKTQPRRLKEAISALDEAQQRLQVSQPLPPLEAGPGVLPGTPLSLQAAIGLSDSALDPDAHCALMALSVFPPKPNSFSEEAALAVCGDDTTVLDALVDIGLLECAAPDRYTLHQTIYDYARLQPPDGNVERRMLDYANAFTSQHGADYASLAVELVNLLAAFEIAERGMWHHDILRLTNGLYDFLETRGLYEICQRLIECALQVARVLEDESKLAEILFRLGDLELRQGKIPAARRHLEKSVSLSQSACDYYLETKASFQLGDANMFGGRWQEGQHIFNTALTLARTQGFQDQEGWILSALGYACMESCEFKNGIEYLEEALKLCSVTGNRRVEGWSHFNLSLIYLPLGYFTLARQHADLCGQCYQELGDQRGQSWLTYHYGRLSRKKGQYGAARRFFEGARFSFENLGDRMGLGFSIHNLGLLEAENGNRQAAGERYAQAIEIFQRTECRLGESQCLQSMGELQRWIQNNAQAEVLLGEALEMRMSFPYPRGIARAQANLALVFLARGNHVAAQQAAQEAVLQARSINARSTLAYTLTAQGKVCLGLGDALTAQAALNEALQLRRILGQQHLLWEPLAHLALLHRAQDDEIQSAAYLHETRSLLNLTPCTAGVDHPESAQCLCQDFLTRRLDVDDRQRFPLYT